MGKKENPKTKDSKEVSHSSKTQQSLKAVEKKKAKEYK